MVGNSKSRALGRPKGRSSSCTCDRFELHVAADETHLLISLITDLPLGSRVAVRAHRIFSTIGDGEWEWTVLDAQILVSLRPDGTAGAAMCVAHEALDNHGLNSYRYLKGRMHLVMDGVPSNSIEIKRSAPIKQHAFGLCNRNLTGLAVAQEPHGHFVERFASVVLPVHVGLLRHLQPNAVPLT